MTDLVVAREAYASQRWRDAFAALTAADHGSALGIDDLERLAISSYLVGEEAASADAWTRAHHEALARGDPPRAARCAFWHACGLLFRGEMAPAMGWVARGKRVLDDHDGDCVEDAWALTLTGLPVMFQGDVETAYPNLVRAAGMARRFGEPTGVTMTCVALGQAEVFRGRVSEGVALLDEAMVSVSAGEVTPIFVGIAYCAVIDACQRLFDLRRAKEWTAALSGWCDEQQDLVPYRGNCLVHRCEIFQLQGAWTDAAQAAEQACEALAGPPPWDSLGAANYQQAEIFRLRGDLSGAEEAYRQASRWGREPEPGMSLVRLAQGQTHAAAASIRRAVGEAQDPGARSKLLPAAIEILIATGDVPNARRLADELQTIAGFLGAPMVHALADHALGAVMLAEGNAPDALAKARAACAAWRQLDVPYEAARARVLIGMACRAIGDVSTAELEFDAARADFVALGAEPDVSRLRRLVGGKDAPPGGLTGRELEVLRLVATGKTNRAVASELVLSEKTVARHVANIFTKLGVSSRSAATAWAYENDLV